MTDIVVQLQDVVKHYGPVKAVDGVSLDIHRGEFFSLLGPSGCGKTTTLRLIAGLEHPDEGGGSIRLLGEIAGHRRPHERPVSMVFQNYALFPHLDVARNVSFGLVERRLARDEIARRVTTALELVRLDPATYAARRPSELSGGQRQRVALARALVLEPPILLLDEPLGALDRQLRKEMQLELRTLNRELGMTFIFVTHDQEEALVMSDRIAVMDRARVAQVGTPAEIYERPRTTFVARFIGACNIFTITAGGGSATVAVRPERLGLYAPDAVPDGQTAIRGTVREILYGGETLQVVVRMADGSDATVALPNSGQLAQPVAWTRGAAVALSWPARAATVLAE